MIIGNGNIAKAIINSDLLDQDLCIIAAGVSNSTERNNKEFDREERMILHTLKDNHHLKVIYFDTFYNQKESPYVRHKHNMKRLIREHADDFLFIGIPILCGTTNNKTQLIPYLTNSLINNKPVTINFKATRNIVPVSSIIECTRIAVDSNFKNVAILSKQSYSMREITKELEIMHQKKFTIKTSRNKYFVNDPPDLEQYEYIYWCNNDLHNTLKYSLYNI